MAVPSFDPGSVSGSATTRVSPGTGRSASMNSPISLWQHRGQPERMKPRISTRLHTIVRAQALHHNSEYRWPARGSESTDMRNIRATRYASAPCESSA
ncbi:hypothetical protein FTUN_0785 [Frigoriglobus tundricola]|uniref:Uncharacterized protein n=1 Tax=Frigoriglobus tundricola TaxID=2774151 RepID=A0A6M5YGV1_9BACT|nr:hypothetical protein FTUN_0785 [Frigoriglobus tundricola]